MCKDTIYPLLEESVNSFSKNSTKEALLSLVASITSPYSNFNPSFKTTDYPLFYYKVIVT